MQQPINKISENLSFLIKPVSGDCNLFCDYCFYRKAVESYPETSVHRMDEKTFTELVRNAQINGRKSVSYIWQGGEPMLMGIDFYKWVVTIQNKFSLPGQAISNIVQTNAVAIDNKWAQFFAQNQFLVGVSLDGPQELHDIHRFTRTRKSVFDKVIQACEILDHYRVEFNILVVVNNDTVQYPLEIYRFLRKRGFHYLQFIPCIEVIDNEKAPFSVSSSDFGTFLCKIFDIWFENDYPEVSIRFFDNFLQFSTGNQPECCMYRRNCGEYLVIEHNGDVYPCDFFVTKEWYLGNILEDTPDEIMTRPKFINFS